VGAVGRSGSASRTVGGGGKWPDKRPRDRVCSNGNLSAVAYRVKRASRSTLHGAAVIAIYSRACYRVSTPHTLFACYNQHALSYAQPDSLSLTTTMPKDVLPLVQGPALEQTRPRRTGTLVRRLTGLVLLVVLAQTYVFFGSAPTAPQRTARVPLHAQQTLEKCRAQALVAGPAPDFRARETSDRFVSGTPSVLVRGGKIWTGANNGTEVIDGDVLLEGGLIKNVGKLGGLSEQDVILRNRMGTLKVFCIF
jgi:hypothetical protein